MKAVEILAVVSSGLAVLLAYHFIKHFEAGAEYQLVKVEPDGRAILIGPPIKRSVFEAMMNGIMFVPVDKP